jgi:hypothetical protein
VVRPERRKRADLIAVVVIVLVVLAASLVLWQRSDIHATESDTAAPARAEPAAAEVPPDLHEVWSAPSPATPLPTVAGPAAVTGEGNQVQGRDPATGQVRWSYTRDLPLCTVGSSWGRALAVYSKGHNCSEVTSLFGTNGERGPSRNSDTGFGTELLDDGRYVTATGHDIIETWRADLVRTQQYGVPTDIKNPHNNIKRPECRYSSVAVGQGRVAVTEQCPGIPVDRLTLLKAQPNSDEKPQEVMSLQLPSGQASVVATDEHHTAVLLRDRGELQVWDDNTHQISGTFPVPASAPPPRGEPDGTANERTIRGPRIYWYTGEDVVALDRATLNPLWTVPDALGPGTGFGGKLLVPVQGGLAVHDPNTGARERVIPVDRHGYSGPVDLNAIGATALEQRGPTVVALR